MNTRAIAAEYRLSHWAQIMRERKESGLSIKAFCEKAGFHENIYFYWQRKLREAASEQLPTPQASSGANVLVPSGFTEIKMQAEQRNVQRFLYQSASDGSLVVEASGVKMTADCSYPAEKLAILLRELVGGC